MRYANKVADWVCEKVNVSDFGHKTFHVSLQLHMKPSSEEPWATIFLKNESGEIAIYLQNIDSQMIFLFDDGKGMQSLCSNKRYSWHRSIGMNLFLVLAERLARSNSEVTSIPSSGTASQFAVLTFPSRANPRQKFAFRCLMKIAIYVGRKYPMVVISDDLISKPKFRLAPSLRIYRDRLKASPLLFSTARDDDEQAFLYNFLELAEYAEYSACHCRIFLRIGYH